jgi:hypothetical protein
LLPFSPKCLSFHLLSKNVKIGTYKTVILPVGLYGLTLREEHRLMMSENRMLRKIFEPGRDEETGGWKSFIIRNFITCTLCQV